MGEITLLRAKRVVCEIINNRIANVMKDYEEYNDVMIRNSCKLEKLQLSNLRTEICLALDREVEITASGHKTK